MNNIKYNQYIKIDCVSTEPSLIGGQISIADFWAVTYEADYYRVDIFIKLLKKLAAQVRMNKLMHHKSSCLEYYLQHSYIKSFFFIISLLLLFFFFFAEFYNFYFK